MKIDADPAELRAFAASLRQILQEIESLNSKATGAMSRVSGSWKDPRQAKTSQQVKTAVASTKKFSLEMQQVEQYVSKLASHLEATP